MKRHLLARMLICVLLSSSLAVSVEATSEWTLTHGETSRDSACTVVAAPDGGYIIAGSTDHPSGNFWLVKTDSDGNMEWNRTHNGGSCNALIRTSDGGYAVAGDGYALGSGDSVFWLAKFDDLGNMEWNRTYGGTGLDLAHSLIETSDGGYAIGGWTASFGAGSADFWLVKTDSDGNMEWNQTYGGTESDIGQAVVGTDDGGYAIAGFTYSFGVGKCDVWLIKTDEYGNEQWNRTYGGTERDFAYSLVTAHDGGYTIFGTKLIKTDENGTMEWNQTYGDPFALLASSLVATSDGGYAIIDETFTKTDENGIMEWSQTYGGNSLIETSDGGYAIAGTLSTVNALGLVDNDFWLGKTDSSGTMEWTQTYGCANSDIAHSVIETSDGGYAMTGESSIGSTNRECLLIKRDESGNANWSRTVGGTGYAVAEGSNDRYAVAGYKYSGTGSYDFWLWITEPPKDFGFSVTKTYGGTSNEVAYSLVATSDGGYALAGYTHSFGAGGADFWLVKTDGVGNMEWNKTYGGTEDDIVYSIVKTSDGGYALAGTTSSFGSGETDFWLVKTDATGNIEWSQTYGGTANEEANSLIATSDGGYALVGYTYSFGSGGADFWLVRTDVTGNMEWNKTYGGPEDDIAYSLVETSYGGYAVAGETHSFGAGGADFWLIETDEFGNMEWDETYGGEDNDGARSVVETSDGGYVSAGFTCSFGAGGADFWLVKTAETGVVPEYTSWLLPSILFVAMFAIIINKKKHINPRSVKT